MKTTEYAIEKQTAPGVWSRVNCHVTELNVEGLVAYYRRTGKLKVRGVRHTIITKVLPF